MGKVRGMGPASLLLLHLLSSCKDQVGLARATKALEASSATQGETLVMGDGPGAFELQVDQDGATDATLELSWVRAIGAVRYAVTFGSGPACGASTEAVSDSYEVTTTSVELPPLPSGEYTLCVTAYDAQGRATDASNNGVRARIAGGL